MSRRVVVSCDKCKREIANYSGEKQVFAVEIANSAIASVGSTDPLAASATQWRVDICAECAAELRKWIRGT